MKPFLLFAGDKYYPCGGWHDFRGYFDSEAEAKDWLLKAESGFDWWHVVSVEANKIVDANWMKK